MSNALPGPPLSLPNWPVWLGIGLGWLVAHWPWWLVRRVAPRLGRVMQLLMVSRRRVAQANIALSLPELDTQQQRDLLRAHFQSLGMSLFEFLRAWWGPLAPLDKGFVLDGLQHIELARSAGRGVILIAPHLTTMEICTRLLCQQVAIAGLFRRHQSAALDWAVMRSRLRHAVAMFGRDELRPAVRHLKSGGVLWFPPDQESRRGDSVFVPFFGHPAWSLTSTHQMARLSGALVMPLLLERRDDGRYRVEIGAPLADFPSSDAHADTARVMALMETQIRRVPAQYLWIHKRYKTQPDGLASPYQ